MGNESESEREREVVRLDAGLELADAWMAWLGVQVLRLAARDRLWQMARVEAGAESGRNGQGDVPSERPVAPEEFEHAMRNWFSLGTLEDHEWSRVLSAATRLEAHGCRIDVAELRKMRSLDPPLPRRPQSGPIRT